MPSPPYSPAAAEELLRRYRAELARVYPTIRFIKKRHDRLSQVIDLVLRVLTLGGQRRYSSHYTTTLGASIYLPDQWEKMTALDRYLVLRHEAVHVEQFLRYGRLRMSLRYLCWPVPFGFAWGRRQLELEGYRETLYATWQVLGSAAARDPGLRQDIVRRFTGPDYGWMWIDGHAIDKALIDMLDYLERQPPPRLTTRPEGQHLI